MTITPTIRPEIKKENERQRYSQMHDKTRNGKRIENSAFDEMMQEELEKVKSKLPKEWVE